MNDNPDAALEDYKKYMMSAMVAINPETGEILGYYGGDDGFGVDKAGAESPHPPSSTMKMVTAATAIEEGDSINSWFNAGSPREFESLKLEDSENLHRQRRLPELHAAQRQPGRPRPRDDSCPTRCATPRTRRCTRSPRNTAPNTILDVRRPDGPAVDEPDPPIKDDTGEPHDVSVNYRMTTTATTLHPARQAVDAEGQNVGRSTIGQLGRLGAHPGRRQLQADRQHRRAVPRRPNGGPRVRDRREGQTPTRSTTTSRSASTRRASATWPRSTPPSRTTATTTSPTSSPRSSDNTGKEVEPRSPSNSTEAGHRRDGRPQDLQWIGSEIGGESETDELDRDYFGKTGTWEAAGKDEDGNEYPDSYNAHAWYVGAIPQLSIAAWVGNVTSESDPIADIRTATTTACSAPTPPTPCGSTP